MSEPESAGASWVYAVIADDVDAGLAGVTGIDGEPLRTVAVPGLAAVVGSVDRTRVEAALSARPPDPQWLEVAARRHHDVVAACFPQVATVPFRLATLYHDDTGVQEALTGRRAQLRAALDTVAHRTEWGVQAYAAGSAESGAKAEPPRSGTEYLLRRRAEAEQREQARRLARESVRVVEERLRPLAVAAVAHPVDAPADLLLNVSYLVDNERGQEFRDAVADLSSTVAGLRVRLTGPWPAYSFVDLTQEAV